MIDWFTVGAQVFNFLILVAILRYFLYGRILKAIEDRQRRIEMQQDQAEQLRKQLSEEWEKARQANEELDRQRDEMLKNVKSELDEFRQQQEAAIRKESDNLRARWHKNLLQQRETFLRSIKHRIVEATTRIARLALRDLADVSLESRMVDRIIQQLEAVDSDVRAELQRRRPTEMPPIIVESSFELNDQQRELVQASLQQVFDNIPSVRFEISRELECGISIQIDSHTLAWNLRDYLDEMDQQLRRMIDEEIESTPSTSVATPGGAA